MVARPRVASFILVSCGMAVLIDLGVVFGPVAGIAEPLDMDHVPDPSALARALDGNNEIDGLVVETCRKYFPALTAGLDDPRAEVLIQDGFAYLDGHPGEFDVILVDSTDPVNLTDEDQATPAAVLFTPDFYRKIKAALRPGGLAAFQRAYRHGR